MTDVERRRSVDANSQFSKAADFIWCNARLLERRLFAYDFTGGSKESVVAALLAYQNEDGGFGNALEPDKRTPASHPVDQEWALRVLDYIDAFDQSMANRGCDFLLKITRPEGGVPLRVPTANDYPRMPWWTAEDNAPAQLNPTASITGYLLKHGVRHPWVERATDYCWKAIATTATREYHDLMPIIIFLENAPDRERAEAELERMAQRISETGVVELDPQATGYAHMPLEWAPTPQSFCARLFSDQVIDTHLEALASRQKLDGGWPMTWEPLSDGVKMEWRSYITLEALKTLRAYRRLGK
jgi:hypothetical protein